LGVDYAGVQIPFLRDDEIRRRADEFRRKYWSDTLPVDIELIAERNLNLLIIPIPNLRYQAHTEAYLSGDLKEIAYDPAAPDVRIRFSVAHEVGHFVLHADVISKLRSRLFEEWKEIQQTLPEALWGRAEYQAREFAGRLLVPPQKVIEALKDLRPLIEQAKKIAPDLELPVIKELVSPKLAKKFFVSDEVIVRRMDAEGISPIQE
jgi:Zn-dependent peptidase ImmA (M78 family)